MKVRLIAVLLSLFCSDPCFADVKLHEGITEESSSTANEKVFVRAEVNKSNQQDCHGWRWGAEDTCPDLVLSNLVVMLGKEKLFIPRSATSDLGMPHRLSVIQRSKNFDIVINGGDASTGYTAVFTFSNAAP